MADVRVHDDVAHAVDDAGVTSTSRSRWNWIVQRFFELAVEHERERVKLARDEERQHDGLAGLRESLLGPALCEAHSFHQRAKARLVMEVLPRRLDVEKHHHRIARLERSLEPRDGL